MKKVLTIIICSIIALTISGCSNNNISSSLSGVYKNDKNVFYIIEVDDEYIEYYVTDEYNNKHYGTLEYKNGVAMNDDFDEIIKVKQNNNNIIVETKNIDYFKAGEYKKIKDLTLDEFFNESYGRINLFGNSNTGKFKNKDGVVYIYQPTNDHIEYMAIVNDYTVGCEVDLKEYDEFICEMFGTTYKVTLDDNKAIYSIVTTEEEKENYEGEFIRDGELTKQEVMKVFDPVYLFND